MKTAKSGDLEIGTLVKFDGNLMVVTYHSATLHATWLSPKQPGHGYVAPISVEVLAKPMSYNLIAVEKGVVGADDMGQIVTAERLREILSGVDTSVHHGRAVPADRNVHWCRRCGPCKCYKRGKVRL